MLLQYLSIKKKKSRKSKQTCFFHLFINSADCAVTTSRHPGYELVTIRARTSRWREHLCKNSPCFCLPWDGSVTPLLQQIRVCHCNLWIWKLRIHNHYYLLTHSFVYNLFVCMYVTTLSQDSYSFKSNENSINLRHIMQDVSNVFQNQRSRQSDVKIIYISRIWCTAVNSTLKNAHWP